MSKGTSSVEALQTFEVHCGGEKAVTGDADKADQSLFPGS
jgi:hypothetical protein